MSKKIADRMRKKLRKTCSPLLRPAVPKAPPEAGFRARAYFDFQFSAASRRRSNLLKSYVTQDSELCALRNHDFQLSADSYPSPPSGRGEENLMRARNLAVCLTLLLISGCNSTQRTAPVVQTSRVYNGTASVGDFLTITIDSGAQTIEYNDISNNTSGTVPYTVNPDGTYALNDPAGNLIAAYEVPNYALLIQAAKTGPNSNTPALITAVESGQISLSTFEGQAYNFMQFRTASGGLNVGSVSVNGQGTGSTSTFWPYGSYNQGQNGGPFSSSMLDLADAQLDSSGTFLKLADPNGSDVDYVFGTANGIFAVDTQNGAILGLQKAASKAFSPAVAGTYTAIYYQKTNAATGNGNVETGTPSLGNATVLVTAGGRLTVTDSSGRQMANSTLTPVADVSYLYGKSGELSDPCYGLFTFRVKTASARQDVFVTFMGQAMLFSSFTANLPWNSGGSGGTYNYFYGVGLKGSN